MEILGVKAAGRSGDETDFAVIDLDEVYYIALDKPSRNAEKAPIFHTKSGPYYQINTLTGLRTLLERHGFTSLDTVNLVNFRNIQQVVKTQFYTHAYFDKDTYATVSDSNLHKVQHLIRVKD